MEEHRRNNNHDWKLRFLFDYFTFRPTDDNAGDDSNEQSKSDSESSDLQKYIESIWKPKHEDIEMAIKAVCSVSDKSKNNGMKGKNIDIKLYYP